MGQSRQIIDDECAALLVYLEQPRTREDIGKFIDTTNERTITDRIKRLNDLGLIVRTPTRPARYIALT